jgi:glycerol-3-phosphate dehydrogenase (NAD(P)+)
MQRFVPEGQLIVSAVKGIEEKTLDTMSDIIEEEIPQANVAILSGPSHAEEVGRGMLTAIVAGAHDKETAVKVQKAFMSPVFRVYTSTDMKGIQLGAALKNVIALAAGVCDGMGYGDNAKAALITRGSEEIARLGEAMGLDRRTLFGLSGIGDLIVTCESKHSRNRKAGYLIGSGYTVEAAMKEVHQVVEGVYSAKAGLKLARMYNVEMPIVEMTNSVLFDGVSAADAAEALMTRKGKDEVQ